MARLGSNKKWTIQVDYSIRFKNNELGDRFTVKTEICGWDAFKPLTVLSRFPDKPITGTRNNCDSGKYVYFSQKKEIAASTLNEDDSFLNRKDEIYARVFVHPENKYDVKKLSGRLQKEFKV